MVKGEKVEGGLIKIENDGKKEEKMVRVREKGVKRVEIKEMKMKEKIMKMRKIEGGMEMKEGKKMKMKQGR